MSSTKGHLPLSSLLTKQAKEALLIPELRSSSLISLGQLCDDNCTVELTKHYLRVYKNGKIILRGIRNYNDGLWDIPVQKTVIHENNYVFPKVYSNTPTKHPSAVPSPQLQRKRKQSKRKQLLQHVFGSMEPLIDSNHTDQCLAEQQKLDHHANVIIRRKQTHVELIKYLHKACFSPTVSTFTKAIKKNHFSSWPGLTTTLVTKHLPKCVATTQGHLTSERQGLQSTSCPRNTYKQRLKNIKERFLHLKQNLKSGQTFQQAFELDIDSDFFPQSETPNARTHNVCYTLLDHDDLSTAYMDTTGKFPQKSSRGHEYILIGYHYDANLIYGIPLKNRKGTTFSDAWEQLHSIFSKAGAAPNTWVLDNEKSRDLLDSFTQAKVDYQLVPPYKHRNNQAERAIQTFKHHFKAGLASVDPSFPLSEWDRLIPQANITLNLLRSSRVNPNLSAYSFIFGEFNFLATPLAPPGTKVVAHISPTKRGSWELNGESGWYVGPSMHHYRCVHCYFPRTQATRDCDTVEFFPHDIAFPQIKLTDYLQQAASDIITLLTQPPSTTTPSLAAGDPIRNALLTLATQLKRIDNIPMDKSPPSSPTKNPTENTTPRPKSLRVGKPSTRVPNNSPTTTTPKDVTPSSRVYDKSPAISTLQQHSNLQKNQRFNNTCAHRYPLRSQSRTIGTNFKQLAAQHLTAMHLFNPYNYAGFHIYRADGTKETIDSLLSGPNWDIWVKSLSNEWGRLAQGNIHGVRSTDTIEFIHHHEVPTDRDVTYAAFVCDYRALKEEPYRIRITVGGDQLSYNDDAGSPAANLLETKLLVNSTISDAKKGARFMSADIKDHFLATPMKRPEYMRVKYHHFPEDIKLKYNLSSKVTSNGYIYIKIKRGMYGLKQAAILAYDHLRNSLAPFGYKPVPGTVGLWEHDTRPTKFCVCVDDFGIKYWSKDDRDHLLNSIGHTFKYTTDLEGKNYCGLTFDWNYDLGYVDISMPNYVTKCLKRLQHVPSVSPQYSPHTHVPIAYGKKGTRQYATTPDTSPLLPPKQIKHIQSITGSFLYYARALDLTMLPALNEISSQQANPTELTKQKCQRLMDYAATYPDIFIRYHASDMVLHVDSDAAYLVAPKARSRIAGYYYLSHHPATTSTPSLNGLVLVECKTLRHVVASAAEAEIAGVFHNAQITLSIRRILEVLNHPQPPTPIKTDNSTANGFIHNNIHQKRSKSWDMRYYWLRERQTKQQFKFFWAPGHDNNGDYVTKHHATKYHLDIRKTKQYVRDKFPNIKFS